MLMKTLGAGRIPPVDGLLFALENSKDTDIITLGLGSVEEAEESLSIVCEQVGESTQHLLAVAPESRWGR